MCDYNQKEYIGAGSISYLGKIVKKIKANNILLITGKQSYVSSGAKRKIDQLLVNVKVEQFNQFEVNPKLEDIYFGISLLKKNKFDIVIAVGGGSVIDMAKSINLLAVQQDDNISKFIKDSSWIRRKGLPLVAIPTTSGTGSEATSFAVVYMESIKYSLDHELILPDYVILDSELSCSMDKKLAAESGIDALCQAIESYWSVKSTAKSKKLAEEAIILMVLSIENAVNGSISDREIMVKASNLAGKAINITKTTAAHAISYPMTSIYGIPHGHAVALTLGEFFIVNSNGNSFDYRGQRYLSDTMKHLFSLFRCKDSLDCRSNWLKIMRNLGLETDIRKLGIKSDSDFNLIVDNIDINRLGNNPVKLEREDLVLLLKEGL